mgnify:CR=1 FL=1
MRQFLVYLAGPISGTSYGESTGWREHVSAQFPPHIVGVSPMRGKRYLSQEKHIADSYGTALSSQKGITCRDRMDVMRSDLVLVNLLDAQKVSIGTVMEIAWADAWRKPLVIVMGEHNMHWHAMIREVAGFIVPTLDEAIAITSAVLSPTID